MNNSRSINLITCMKFFKTLINNDTEFINKDKLKSLEGLKTARSNYCHLLWLKSIIEDMKSHVDEAIDKYNTNIEPLINNISQVTNEDNESLYYGMWNLNYQNYNDLFPIILLCSNFGNRHRFFLILRCGRFSAPNLGLRVLS